MRATLLESRGSARRSGSGRLVTLTAGCLLAMACGGAGGRVGEAERPYQVALHVHGSFSEGSASMALQATRAREAGYDALWWTDHDWRVARHTHLGQAELAAEGCRSVPPRGAAWSPDFRCIEVGWEEVGGSARGTGKVSDEDPVCRGIKISAGGGEAESRRVVRLIADGGRWKASLAHRPHLKVEGRFRGDGGSAEIELVLSERPGGDGVALPTTLLYPLGGSRSVEASAPGLGLGSGDGRVSVRPASAPRLARSVDHSLSSIGFVVSAPAGATAELCVTSVELGVEADGSEALRVRAELARDLEERIGLAQYEGLELSYSNHLVALWPEAASLPDFSRFPHGMEGRAAVDWIRDGGGLAIYAHPFGAGWSRARATPSRLEERATLALEEELFGAGILEVGYRRRVGDLGQHLELWDRLLEAGLTVVGVGTNDSHHGSQGWAEGPNDFATWVWAESPRAADLLRGLSAGRAYFGPARPNLRLDLSAGGRVAMGGRGERRGPVEMMLDLQGHPEGSELRWVVDGEVLPSRPLGPGPVRSPLLVPGGASWVRAEVWAGPEPVALSNPVYLRGGPDEP